MIKFLVILFFLFPIDWNPKGKWYMYEMGYWDATHWNINCNIEPNDNDCAKFVNCVLENIRAGNLKAYDKDHPAWMFITCEYKGKKTIYRIFNYLKYKP